MPAKTPAQTAIDKLLARLPTGDLDYMAFLNAIYHTRFTGPYTVHCLNGVPRQISFGHPIQLTICSPVTAESAAPAAASPLDSDPAARPDSLAPQKVR